MWSSRPKAAEGRLSCQGNAVFSSPGVNAVGLGGSDRSAALAAGLSCGLVFDPSQGFFSSE